MDTAKDTSGVIQESSENTEIVFTEQHEKIIKYVCLNTC